MKQQIAVFDIDGTLCNASLGVEFLKEMSNLHAIQGITQELFSKQYNEWCEQTDRTAYYDKHLDRYYDLNLIGVDRRLFERAAEQVALHTYPHFYSEIIDELKHHQEEGRFIVVISKSPEQAVAQVAKLVGANDYWGWRFRFDELGKYVDQFTYPDGESDKANIIRTLALKHNLTLDDSFAYGDSYGDISMLELVRNSTAVNPEPKLLAVAKANSWRIIQTVRD